VKKINQLVLKSFLGPFVMTFFICLFILLMQFLWKYVDDLVGKGLGWFLITKLMIFASATLVPLALPLALLLSSIMTFGNLAEQYELVACKSAGLSLQRVMRPLIIAAVLLSGAAFYFANNLLPIANFKMYSLLYDVRQQKPALYIKEGVFYNGIEGYIIRVGKKNPDGKTIQDVIIYDHTDGVGNNKMIMAESGTMVMSDDERFLILTLKKGSSYEEQYDSRQRTKSSRPFMRTEFDSETVRFDLSSFKMNRTDETLFKDNYQMLNLRQLENAEATIQSKIDKRKSELAGILYPLYVGSVKETKTKPDLSNPDFLKNFDEDKRPIIVSSAISAVRNYQSYAADAATDIQQRNKLLYRHQIEWHRKFSLSFACLILFFIGAPLGAIIRKGGLGMPVVVSIFFFVTYHIISITGEKFVREGFMAAYKGMWLSSAILFPLGVFLTYKATTDSSLFDTDSYLRFFRKLKNPFRK